VGYILQTRDLTKQYLQYAQTLLDFRPSASQQYPPGTVCMIAPLDQQQYPDQGTIIPTPAASTAAVPTLPPFNVVGVVALQWPGFDGAGFPPNYTAPPNVISGARGTQGILCVIGGYAPAVRVDATAGEDIVNGTLLVPSTTTAGCVEGSDTLPTVAFGVVGGAALPAAGIGSSIASGALAQASQTATIATPAAGDVINLQLQMPYSDTEPGVVQTVTYSMPITSGMTATTAAAAFATYLNGIPGFTKFYTATSAAGVVTVAVNALSSPFYVNYGMGQTVTGGFVIGLSGQIGNYMTLATSVSGSGGTTFAAGGATLAGGAGFLGTIPAYIGDAM
jgi:hypothetical protein